MIDVIVITWVPSPAPWAPPRKEKKRAERRPLGGQRQRARGAGAKEGREMKHRQYVAYQ